MSRDSPTSLTKARLAAYGEEDLKDVPAPLVEKYFDRRDQRYLFRKDLRRCVIFGRNDLIQDAPISRVDLLACRNTDVLRRTDAGAHPGALPLRAQ